MLLLMEYTMKPHISKEEMVEAMGVWEEHGEGPGELVAHWQRLEGNGGVKVLQTDDPEAVYRYNLNFTPFLTMKLTSVINVDSAVPQIMDYLS